MMPSLNLSISCKTLIEHFKVLHALYVNQTPSRNTAAASSADLPTKQADNSILNAVVMRLNEPLIAFVSEPDQSFVCNGAAKHLIQLLIDSHFKLHYHFTASYFLGRGGISDTSTGSNSNLGSSASGAKYALVVFRKFLSSRSGKSGL